MCSPNYKKKAPQLSNYNLEGVQCPGHSNGTFCGPLSLIWSEIVSNFFSFILGSLFLFPSHKANVGERVEPHSDKTVSDENSSSTLKIDETYMLQCPEKPNGPISRSYSHFGGDLYFSDLNQT